jgi:hypothetical protein
VDDNSQNHSISARTFSLRLWQGDEDWFLNHCKQTGRKPAEAARELFGEAVRLHRAALLDSRVREPETTTAEALNRLSERIQCQEEMLCNHYGLMLELLMAFCELRNLIWKQLSSPASRSNGDVPEPSPGVWGDAVLDRVRGIIEKEANKGANHDQTRSQRA